MVFLYFVRTASSCTFIYSFCISICFSCTCVFWKYSFTLNKVNV